MGGVWSLMSFRGTLVFDVCPNVTGRSPRRLGALASPQRRDYTVTLGSHYRICPKILRHKGGVAMSMTTSSVENFVYQAGSRGRGQQKMQKTKLCIFNWLHNQEVNRNRKSVPHHPEKTFI